MLASYIGVLVPFWLLVLRVGLVLYYTAPMPRESALPIRWRTWARLPDNLAGLGLGFMVLAGFASMTNADIDRGIVRFAMAFGYFLALLLAMHMGQTLAGDRPGELVWVILGNIVAVVLAVLAAATVSGRALF